MSTRGNVLFTIIALALTYLAVTNKSAISGYVRSLTGTGRPYIGRGLTGDGGNIQVSGYARSTSRDVSPYKRSYPRPRI